MCRSSPRGHLDRLHALGCGAETAFRWVSASQNATNVRAPFRTILDHATKIGMPVGIHGDGVHIAPLNPWLHIYFATTGIGSFDTQINAGQQLTREGGAAALHARQQLLHHDPGALH